MLDGLVLPVQIVEQSVDFVDLGVLLLFLEVDEFVELSEVAEVGALQAVVSLEQGRYLDAVFGLLD